MKGFKKEIWVTFMLVMALGVFFQLNRMDAFLHIGSWTNSSAAGEAGQESEFSSLSREKYLVIYDPGEVQSVLKRHIVEKILLEQKKEVVRRSIYQGGEVDASCRGVIIAAGRLTDMKCLPAVERYVEQGGTAMLLSQLQPEQLPSGMLGKLGVASVGQEASAYGIRVTGDMYPGLQGFGFDSAGYATTLTQAVLLPEARTEVTAGDGTPIVWSNQCGKGRYLVCNSRERDDKNSYGMYTAMLGQLHEDYVYPVMNMKLFFIDDFPSPVPEGNFDRIYQETGLSTADFYRKLWWPEMLNDGKKYNWKYTGLVIESYGSQVKGPFQPLANGEARNGLIVYGRELLKAGGELGIHGYNHQSLAPAGYGQERLGYNAWESQQDMVESLQEVKRYVEEVYPGYELHSYVPPSNILSPEGKAAIKSVFPDMKVYASLYNGLADAKEYFQNFQVNKDGTCEIPRVSSGYAPAPEDIWESYNVVCYNGVFSHFVHPDEIFYEESSNLSWAVMKKGLRELFEDIDRRFGWLEPATASEGADIMKNYFAMDYRVERSSDGMKLHCWNFSRPLTFILRSGREVGHISGGKARRIQQDAYVLTVEEPEFSLEWAGERP
ncbi:DUF2194 domain-containing protein [Anaerovibrio sp.]|uniref:DUF2194 domain-containing protein n=1 Tax=Anaerovibrio sp. TaxID=1872532 RepID=UPI003F17F16B